MSATTKKTVLEVLPGAYKKVKAGAAKSNQSIKKFTSILLDYALTKMDAGQLRFIEPSLSEFDPKNKKEASK